MKPRGRRCPPATGAPRHHLLFVIGAAGLGCTTLGPVPAMTGVSPRPIARPGVEAQLAAVPGYYLSSSVQEEPQASSLPQLAGWFEPDSLIGVPGLFVGARYAGDSGTGAALEPLLGYRGFLDAERRFSLGGVGFGAYATAEDKGASFSAWRGGLEGGVDARITDVSHWAELHANAGATLTVLSAEGRYCVDVDGRFGVDCPDDPDTRSPISAEASGVYPSGRVGVSLELGRHLASVFHGVRLGLDLAGGTLPSVESGAQRPAKLYGTAGLSLTVGLGAVARPAENRAP